MHSACAKNQAPDLKLHYILISCIMQCSPATSPPTAQKTAAAAPTPHPTPVPVPVVSPLPAPAAPPAVVPAAVEIFNEPSAVELKEAADIAVEQTVAAVAAGDAFGAADAASTLEDVVDDQISLSKEEAVEAVVGLVDAAADAEEAAQDAEDILTHATEKEAESTVITEEAAPAASSVTAAPDAEESESSSAPAVVADAPVVVEEEPAAPAVVEEKAPETPADAPAVATAAVAAAAATAAAVATAPKSTGPSLPAQKKKSAEKIAPKKEEATAPIEKAAPIVAAVNGAAAAAATEKEGDAEPEVEAETAVVSSIPELIPEEPENAFETLDGIEHPVLNFEGAPSGEAPLTTVEEKIRDMSLAAHKLIKDNNNKMKQAVEQQGAALELALGEGSGKVRPSLVAACAFALADMVLVQGKVNETRVALATAYDAAQHVENRGAAVRALMNYNYILRSENKIKSAKHAYATAYDLVKAQYGVSHPQVEQVKYEYSGFLAKTGRVAEALEILETAANELAVEGERLEKEESSEEVSIPEEASKKTAIVDPGTGLEHLEAEANDAGEGETTTLTPSGMAYSYSMRNLMHAGGLLGALGKVEEAEAAMTRSIEIAVKVFGENSRAHVETLYSLGGHYRRQGQVEQAIQANEAALSIMDETIEVYEPELLQTRISILRDTATLYDKVGALESAIDYATGALVNAQTLAKIMAQMPGAPPGMSVQMLQPYYTMLADLKTKAGDDEGAAEAKRLGLKSKLNQGIANRSGKSSGQRSGGGKKSGSSRAGGRRG